MARKKKQEKLDDFTAHWQSEIKAGLKYRKKFSSHDTWKDNRDYYRGKWDTEKGGLLPVNKVFSFGRSLIPQVYFHAPRVTVTALTPELNEHAKVIEAVDNQLIRLAMLKRTLKSSTLDTYLCGTGPIKLGFDSEFGYSPEHAVGDSGETATQESRKEYRSVEYKSYIKPGYPWALSTRPEDVVVPYGYKYGDDLPWVAHRVLRLLDDVKEDSKYSNTADLEGTKVAPLDPAERRSHPMADFTELKFAELWEIRDKRDGKIHVMCEKNTLLSDDDAILRAAGMPWEFLIFNEDPEHFWGIPDVDMILEQQKELNEVRTQAQRHRMIALLKFLALKGVMDEDAVDKFLSGEVGPYVEIDAESLAAAIQILQPHVPVDLLPWTQSIKDDMREVLGYDENAMPAFKGGTPPTAAETMQVAGSRDLRNSERKDILADNLVNIVTKWNEMAFEFWNQERVIEVAGPRGAMEWVQFTGGQLRGEYLLRVDPESGFPINRMVRQQVAEKLLALFGGDPQVDANSLKRIVLEQYEWVFPGVSNVLKMMRPELAQALAGMRQPTPMGMGSTGRQAQGNRGGGQRASTPASPIPFEKFKQRSETEGR